VAECLSVAGLVLVGRWPSACRSVAWCLSATGLVITPG